MKYYSYAILFSIAYLIFSCNPAGNVIDLPTSTTEIYDSGGELMPEQAAFDVNYYDLTLEVKPENKWIGGSLAMTCTAVKDLDLVVLQLDTLMVVSSITDTDGNELNWKAGNGLIAIGTGSMVIKGQQFTAVVNYAGKPLAVENAERYGWADGFFWEKTEDGQPWVGNVSVLNGADIWWPCKDHPSDEPDSMAINITVDNELKVAANGQLRELVKNDDGTDTYRWFVSTPINNYSVTMNIAPYIQIDTVFNSVDGTSFPFSFWALPEHYDLARNQFPHFVENMKFLEELLGPYPFRIDKYGSAETYYLGMENQSIIAYGSTFDMNKWGFDWLHFHELTHEWFASLVTAKDWRDWWVHEGITTYIESLYAEHLAGGDEQVYLDYLAETMERVKNEKPVVLPHSNVTTREGYIGDVYSKGSSIMHSLRYLLGKEKMIELLRTMTYPTDESRTVTDGSHTRLASTDEFVSLASKIHGESLDWFFDAYLYHAELPNLVVETLENRKLLHWETGSDMPFTMPVPVEVGDEIRIVKMEGGKGEIEFNDSDIAVDPEGRFLKKVTFKDQ